MPRNSNDQFLLRFLVFFSAVSVLLSDSIHVSGHANLGHRGLLTFKETPGGSNVTFDCSPSGPCVSCQYSEKKDEKYRCSETGYRIPFNCVEIKPVAKTKDGKQSQTSRSAMQVAGHDTNVSVGLDDGPRSASNEGRILADDSKGEPQSYITYRSCIPAVNEEKVSVLGFEGIVLCLLLISGSFVYYRRKQSVNAMPGAGGGRIQMTRF